MAHVISALCIVFFIIITAAGVDAQSMPGSQANGDPTAIASSENNNIEILGLDSTAFPKMKVNLFIDKFCALSGNLNVKTSRLKRMQTIELSIIFTSRAMHPAISLTSL